MNVFSSLAMGGYASYVWSAYGLVAAVFVINIVAIKRQRLKTKKILKQWFGELEA